MYTEVYTSYNNIDNDTVSKFMQYFRTLDSIHNKLTITNRNFLPINKSSIQIAKQHCHFQYKLHNIAILHSEYHSSFIIILNILSN